jgi:hypothetical protein
MVDFAYITELLRATVNDLPWLEPTVKEQVSQSLLMHIEELPLDAFPNLSTGSPICKLILSWKTFQWE